jgi:hypothetical protein
MAPDESVLGGVRIGDRRAVCASERTRPSLSCLDQGVGRLQETHMYIGGGILGTILIIALIVYLVRRM